MPKREIWQNRATHLARANRRYVTIFDIADDE